MTTGSHGVPMNRADSSATPGPTADSGGAAAARRQLGRRLRDLREARAITVELAHEHIGRSRPWLWKLETGRASIQIKPRVDVRLLCELYGADADTQAGLISLAEATRVKGWYTPFKDLLPPNFDTYLGLEEVAQLVSWYEAELVPGLMQTPEYARATITSVEDRPDDEVERRVNLRMRRQQVLTRANPVTLDVIVNEAVLRRPVASTQVMAAQLRHVLNLADLSNVTIRVIPFSAGIHAGVTSGPFEILRFPDGDHEQPPLVYVEGLMGVLWFKEPKEVDKYHTVFTKIKDRALDKNASRELINKAAKEMARA